MPDRTKPEDPSTPGWYPDPWSADGKGERYFDGKRWGSTERPRGRHTATGLKFVADGTTTEAPDRQRDAYLPKRYSPTRWAPVLVAWSDEAHDPGLAGYVAGIAGPSTVYTPSGKAVYVSGIVVLDREQLSSTSTPDRALAQAVIQHELGHLVGLDHTADRNQLMFSESQFNVRDYADGDRRGLGADGIAAVRPRDLNRPTSLKS